MPPKFSLQSILDYHKSRVELLEMELGRLVATRQEGLDALTKLNIEQNRLIEELVGFQSGELDLHIIAQARLNLKRNQTKTKTQEDDLKVIEQAIRAKQDEIILAKQDEAVFDKLKDKEIERFNEKIKTQEKNVQSDIYISQAHRQSHKDGKEETQ